MSEQSDPTTQGRADLVAWDRARPRNHFEIDANLHHLLRMHLGDEQFQEHWPMLMRAGELSAQSMDLLARESNRDENLPRLQRFDGVGQQVEQVVFHPSYHQLGAQIWSTGVLSVLARPDSDVLCGALAYLVTHNGEAGHVCPVACTAGLIKLLQRVGSEAQREHYLPRLLETDYGRRLHAAQFVTEVQGGSDVGLNGCVAVPDPQQAGHYRITGEKWFCSVMDAQLFVITARVGSTTGTGGLGLFLVPRQVDGTINNFTIRRLKYKLGTRSMASGEADFHGALGEPIGLPHRGFKNLISIVLDTSRVHNAVAASGSMRRAYIEALTFARHRVAFSRPIVDHPMLRERLARMRVLTSAAVSTTFRILAMSDRLLDPQAKPDEDLTAARRTHVNINKYWTAIKCTEVVRDGIEVLGGNGTIEEFSVLPRLYRDAIVLESWEGSHNTLCAQVLRDFAQRGLHRQWLAEVRDAVERVRHESLREHHDRATTVLKDVARRIDHLLAGPARSGEASRAKQEDYASLHIRRVVDRMCLLNSYVSLLLELNWELEQQITSDKAAVVDLYRLLYIDRVDPMDREDLVPLFAKVTGL